MAEAVEIRITASNGASQVFRAVAADAQKMGDAVEQAGKSGDGFQSLSAQVQQFDDEIRDVGQALTAFGAGITAAVAIGANNFMQLESAMANVNSIAGQTDAQLAGTTDQVRSLAVELGTSPTGLAEGLYDIVSSGFDAAEGMEVLRVSAIAARAGLTDTGTAATAITAVLNAYGMEASEASDVSDVLFKTVDRGVITFEELASSMGRVLPLANTLSVSVEELGAAYAEMTLQGISASEAETGLSAILTAAINPTTALAEAIEEYGYQSAEALIQTEGLAGFLEFLWDASEGSASGMSELTGNVRATNAALVLAQDGASGFTDRLVEMENASGRTAEVFATQMETTAASIDRARAAIGDLGITLGAAIAPGLNIAADAIGGFTSNIRALPPEMQRITSLATAAVGGLSLMTGGFLLLLPRIVETRAAIQTLSAQSGVLGAMARSIGPLTAGLAALTVGGGLLAAAWGKQREEAELTRQSYQELSDTLEELRIQGVNTSLFEGLQEDLEDIRGMTEPTMDEWRAYARFLELSEVEIQRRYDDIIDEHRVSAGELAAATETITQALNDPRLDRTAFFEELERLRDIMEISEFDEFGPDWFFNAVANIDLSRFRAEVDETAEAIEGIADAGTVAGGALVTMISDAEAAAEATDSLVESLVKVGEAGTEGFLGQIERLQEFTASIRALAGADSALSTINLAGMASDMSLLAEEGIRAGQAFDNTFRILVTNVQGIGEGVQQATDWMESLVSINERGFYVVNELATEGRISWTQAEAAVAAYNQTAERNYHIQQDLLAIQALQAPFIAEQVAATEAYVHQLSNMDAAAQRTTLAFMDLQTVQQAQELITLGNSQAFAEMGENGRAAFEATIQGALQVNPLLFEVLESMGIINGTPLNFEVDYSALAAGGDAIQELTRNVENLVTTLREIYKLDPLEVPVSVPGVEEANDQLLGLTPNLQALEDLGGGGGVTVPIQIDLQGSIFGGGGDPLDLFSGGDLATGLSNALGGAGGVVEIPVAPKASGELLTATDLGAPEEVEVPITPVPEGGEITAADLGAPESIEIPVTLDVDASALNAFGLGFEGEGAAGFTPPTAYIDVAIGQNELDDWTPPELSDATVDVVLSGEAEAVAGLGRVINTATVVEGSDPDVFVRVSGSGIAVSALQGVESAANNVEAADADVSVSVSGAALAIGQLHAVANAAANIPSSVSTTITTYRDTINRTFNQSFNRPAGVMTGGTIWSGLTAQSGRTVLVGEAGPELVNLPHGSQVTPHGASMSRLEGMREPAGGDTYILHVHGNVYGIEDLAEAIERSVIDRRRGYAGVTA